MNHTLRTCESHYFFYIHIYLYIFYFLRVGLVVCFGLISIKAISNHFAPGPYNEHVRSSNLPQKRSACMGPGLDRASPLQRKPGLSCPVGSPKIDWHGDKDYKLMIHALMHMWHAWGQDLLFQLWLGYYGVCMLHTVQDLQMLAWIIMENPTH